jgi:hypothetical protein
LFPSIHSQRDSVTSRKGPKNQNITFLMSADGFHHFWQSFCEEILKKVSACFYEITY